MTEINKLPVGTFCRFAGNVIYMVKNNFDNSYTLVPIIGFVPQDRLFNAKVYVYKRIQDDWITLAKSWVEHCHNENRLDNLSYIENLDILKSYGV